jgi:hypothetical protein
MPSDWDGTPIPFDRLAAGEGVVGNYPQFPYLSPVVPIVPIPTPAGATPMRQM